MAKLKTAELIGAALDYAVAKVMVASGVFTEDAYEFGTGRPYFNVKAAPCLWGCGEQKANWLDLETGNPQVHHGPGGTYSPSTNWQHGGPLVDQFNIDIEHQDHGHVVASIYTPRGQYDVDYSGPDALTAVCRAVVAAKFGVEVEIPDELL